MNDDIGLIACMCDEHSKMLRVELAQRGLSSLVREKEGLVTEEDEFCPLLMAQKGLLENTLRTTGHAFVEAKTECPICFLVEQCDCGEEVCGFVGWISDSADNSLRVASDLGLLATA